MADTLQDMAAALGVAALSAEEETLLLDASRDVAHGSQRRYAPLSTFLLGVAVAGSTDRAADLRAAVSRLQAVLSDAQDPPAS